MGNFKEYLKDYDIAKNMKKLDGCYENIVLFCYEKKQNNQF